MVGAMLRFWSKTTNNLHLPCGMVGPTLFDVAAITFLLQNGDTITFDMRLEKEFNINFKSSYGEFIRSNMSDDGTLITYNELIASFSYWLNDIVFCSRSVTMRKLYIPLVALIHETKHKLCLAKLFLENLYDELGQMIDNLYNKSSISVRDLLWFVQLWLNAVFEKHM
ncbi:hypothetical protein AHAS_Ahas11G0157500 [Arachis hypogaea]